VGTNPPSSIPTDHPAPISYLSLIYGALSLGVAGMANAVFSTELPDLKHALNISEGPLGTAITVGSVCGFPMMLLGSWLINRFGANRIAAFSAGCIAVGLAGLSLTRNAIELAASLAVYQAGYGLIIVTANAAGISLEQAGRKPILPFMHACYSGFIAGGAICWGLYLHSGFPFRGAYLAVAALLVGFCISVLLLRPLPESRAEKPSVRRSLSERSLFFDLRIWAIAGIVFLAMTGDGTLMTWSTIYLRDTIHSTALLGSLGLATFHIAMMLGRFSVFFALRKFTRRQVLAIAGLMAALAMAASLATDVYLIVIAGFFAVGLSLSAVHPLGISIGGDWRPGRAGEVSMVLNTGAAISHSFIPLIIGWSAQSFGMRAALGIVVPVGLLIALLGPKTDKRPA
jgi:fucose permease